MFQSIAQNPIYSRLTHLWSDMAVPQSCPCPLNCATTLVFGSIRSKLRRLPTLANFYGKSLWHRAMTVTKGSCATVWTFGMQWRKYFYFGIHSDEFQFVRLKSATVWMVILFGKPPRLGASMVLTCLHLNMVRIFCQSWCISLHFCNNMGFFCAHVL